MPTTSVPKKFWLWQMPQLNDSESPHCVSTWFTPIANFRPSDSVTVLAPSQV